MKILDESGGTILLLIKKFLIKSAAFFCPGFVVSLPSKESADKTLRLLKRSSLVIKRAYSFALLKSASKKTGLVFLNKEHPQQRIIKVVIKKLFVKHSLFY